MKEDLPIQRKAIHHQHSEQKKPHEGKVESKGYAEQLTKLTTNDNVLIAVGVGLIVIVLLFVFNLDSFSTVFGGGDVVAKVNGEKIFSTDVDEELSRVPGEYKQALGLTDDQLRKTILDQLIAKELLLQEGEKQKITVIDAEVKTTLDQLKVQSGLTEEAYQQRLKEQKFTEQEMVDLVREQLLINKLATQVLLPQITVTDDELRASFAQLKDQLTQVKASHILVCYKGKESCTSERSESEALARVKEVLEKLGAGVSFDDLAAQYSDEPNAATTKGSLGWFKRGQMVKAFEDAAFKLKVGEVSRAVQTQFGYHLIKVLEKKSRYEDFADQLRTQLATQKQQTALLQYVETLKQQAEVTYPSVVKEAEVTATVSIGNNPPVQASG